jgi:hypothetical protein
MPVLYQHKDSSRHYTVTRIAGKFVTFQVSPAGASKLRVAGIKDGQIFPRDLLFALYREGELSTAASGAFDSDDQSTNQAEFDFAGDLTSDTLFPVCDCCSTVFGLSLIVVKAGPRLAGEVTCSRCFGDFGLDSDFRTPLPVPKKDLGETLLFLKRLSRKQPNVAKLEHILRTVS